MAKRASKKAASLEVKSGKEKKREGAERPVEEAAPAGALEPYRERPAGTVLTTDQGIPIGHTDDSLKAGVRGPTLLEDFHFREKMMRFDHERIPERVVHARGSGAHGYFQVYESLERYTCADFLCDPSARTPVFVRFSTVVGSRGSADTVRDARGFATKFYTRQGNFDLVGNNIPVFFIQDGIKFPDLVHAIKPEPHHEMPQASAAHDTFWDFVSLVPETMHMVMWVMSDRGIPRSYRMMEGFGVHTFRLVDRAGDAVLCKFHWKPLLGTHSLVWDEAQELMGRDPDFHRRDLWEAIEKGDFPEFELGLQIVREKDQLAFGFDMLDATKMLPEELVPIERVGRLTLDRNPDNFFAETEQVAFCIANVVPGIDFSDDPLLQARLFSYLDTQLTRLGGPNFAELPINRPLAPVHNHQQDGFHRTTIATGRALYHPNSIEDDMPALAGPHPERFEHRGTSTEGAKTRERNPRFQDHYGQARLFLHSQSPAERRHLTDACRFELAKVERLYIRERVIEHFREIDEDFALDVAAAIGVTPAQRSPNGDREKGAGSGTSQRLKSSPALSIENAPKDSIQSRKVAALVGEGVSADDLDAMREALRLAGAHLELIGDALGDVDSLEGRAIEIQKTFFTSASVFYDAVYVPGGAKSVEALTAHPRAVRFVAEAFGHAKPIGATGDGVALLTAAGVPTSPPKKGAVAQDLGVVTSAGGRLGDFTDAWIDAMTQHRHFGREPGDRPKA